MDARGQAKKTRAKAIPACCGHETDTCYCNFEPTRALSQTELCVCVCGSFSQTKLSVALRPAYAAYASQAASHSFDLGRTSYFASDPPSAIERRPRRGLQFGLLKTNFEVDLAFMACHEPNDLILEQFGYSESI